jgi:hypothetical protein
VRFPKHFFVHSRIFQEKNNINEDISSPERDVETLEGNTAGQERKGNELKILAENTDSDR